MRDRTFSRATLLLAAALTCLLPVAAAAQAVTTHLTAMEVFDPFGVMGNPIGASISPGTVTCPGSQPTGDPMQPCPTGSPIHLRSVAGRSSFMSESPLLRGTFSWELNANFDASGAGRAWGTFRLELEAGGSWQGSWTDDRTKAEGVNAWSGRGRFVGRGTGGSVEGLQLRFSEAGVTNTLIPFFWAMPVDAKVLAPPSH